ncbi:hypothetical protein GCM10027160_05020 [Streptomyces calidiresistens]|uniref:Uncharacterized protein n=1 Tax=Streptomyces calidiresistens TaxID=1485586 RepID=A0A7W3T4X6_9ACTN|nr:hypothetical protein [Streptomyces calidiresistens]MBB0230848.1 hypothetical protein [Streptomyces calidiresistens]
MPVRPEVGDLIESGTLPSEEADEEEIRNAQGLLERVTPPVSDEEAVRLAALFGPDGCYGLAWALPHLVESAPGAASATYPNPGGNEWVDLLNARVRAGRERAGGKDGSSSSSGRLRPMNPAGCSPPAHRTTHRTARRTARPPGGAQPLPVRGAWCHMKGLLHTYAPPQKT